MTVGELVASMVHDVDVKLRAEREWAKRIDSSLKTAAELIREHGLTYGEVERLVMEGLVEKGYPADVKAGVGAERLRKGIKALV